jgi:hypothetical protein
MKGEFTFYVGVDWGVEFHQACILDAHGEKICQRRIEHSGPGMLEFCDFLQALTNGEASALAVAIEVPRGPIVEALLEHDYAVSRSIQSNWIASATGTRLREQKTIAGMPWLQLIPCAPISTVFDVCDQSIRMSFAFVNSPGQKRLLASTYAGA